MNLENTEKSSILTIASPWLGGSGSVGFRVSDEVSKRGFKTHFLSYEIPFKEEASNSFVEFHEVDPFSYPLFPFKIYELALAEAIVQKVVDLKIDVVHAHYGILFGHAAALAKCILSDMGRDLRLIVTFHGSDAIGFDLENPGSIVPKNLNHWLIEKADIVTTASKSLANQMREIYGFNKDVVIIPNFIDTSKFTFSEREFEPLSIVHVSNFRQVKRPIIAVKVFEKLKKTFPFLHLDLVGDGPELSGVKTYIDAMGLSDVFFHGVIKDEPAMIELYQKAHLMLLPSIYENFPLAALEAQSCGLPVVASNVGGVSEVIADDRTGFLLDKMDIDGFVEKSKFLLSSRTTWREFSIRARQNAEQFSTVSVIDQYLSVY